MPFIVLEGLDGAGKSTQLNFLQQKLADAGKPYEFLHFPRFDAPVYGDLIARFLRGELGALESVDPYLVALIYAGDRLEAAPMIRQWLAAGKTVIADRYVYSNVAYQCAKVPAEQQERLREWILALEYGHNGIPEPDRSLFLDVPFSFTRRKLEENRQGEDRAYLGGGSDIHEASLPFQERVREVYLAQEARDERFRVIPCAGPGGKMLPPEAIFSRIASEIAFFL